jgi:predicted CopG family antitoxin
MIKNEVLEELYKIKEDYAKSFNYDLDLIVAHLQKKEANSDRKFIYKSLKTNKTYL